MAPGISLDGGNAWDDSALISSWDEAVAEYKKYHSIYASGKRLEDVLSEEELKVLKEEEGDLIEDVEIKSEIVDRNTNAAPGGSETVESSVNDRIKRGTSTSPTQEAIHPGKAQEVSSTAETQQPPPWGAHAASVPQAILGSVEDEKLKNLMMSWYYAGYYTGIYAGQQQGVCKEPQE